MDNDIPMLLWRHSPHPHNKSPLMSYLVTCVCAGDVLLIILVTVVCALQISVRNQLLVANDW